MELYQLRTFITVAEIGNLTQASERLFTSQPAVSAHIKALEEELQVKLFDRTARGMQLTENGIVLRDKARQVLDSSNDLKLIARTLQNELSGLVRIGLNTDTEYLRLARWHNALLSQYPELRIQLSNSTTTELIKEVKNGALDGSFISGDSNSNDLLDIHLLSTRAVVAGASKWQKQLKNAGREQLSLLPWIQPEPQCIYHRFINELFSKTKNKPNRVTTSANEDSTLALLRAGTGLSIIRDDEASKLLEKNEIVLWEEESFKIPLRFVYLKSRQDDPLVKALLEIMKDSFEV